MLMPPAWSSAIAAERSLMRSARAANVRARRTRPQPASSTDFQRTRPMAFCSNAKCSRAREARASVASYWLGNERTLSLSVLISNVLQPSRRIEALAAGIENPRLLVVEQDTQERILAPRGHRL